ncbi:MAG: fasciclin domain-containing protein [Pseudomonadota bacterium]
MKSFLRNAAIGAAFTVAAATTAIAGDTIVDKAVATDDLSTLVTAVQAADLVETLSGEGPFTVFAPTNAAFEALPAGALDGLLADKDALTGVLTYHVVGGKVMAADVVALIEGAGGEASVDTVNGGSLTASIVDGGVVLTDAKGNAINVVAADVDASNGVVHVIDGVLLP